ncbi:MAG: protein kinase [Tepidisphaeraceae bacterium]
MTVDEEVAARTYQYKHGDRPLEGYTIQRAAGRGGFGEVYYAVSDSGREVALKLVMTYEQIELRGISQCMNLKSPQLVTIFDVKYGTDGRPWVIMEYVSGPSLRDLLDAAPSGLGAAKAAFFLREIGKGLTYLHDCGIVHRDLKPGNIFYENGYVKIGDYGLSKAMSMTRHSGQTVAVGTLHYMAPEIGQGRYDRTIDIYALGALLFEMLTGQVPFFGSSVAEVLMKHLTSEVCLDGIEEPFQSVIRKAMAKNPADRFQGVQEMVEAVFGSEHVRNSVSQFSPASLTLVAGRAAQRVGGAPGPFIPPGRGAAPDDKWERVAARLSAKLGQVGDRLKDVGDRIAGKRWAGNRAAAGPKGTDPLTPAARIVLAILATCLAAFIAAVGASGRNGTLDAFFVFFAIAGSVIGVNIAWRITGSSLRAESNWVQRFALGAPAAFGAAILSFPWWVGHNSLATTLLACFGAMLLIQWEQRLSPDRKERLSVGHLFTAGICALVLAGMMANNQPLIAIATVAGASAAVSLSSVWGRLPGPMRPSPAVSPAPPHATPTAMPPPFGAPPIPPAPVAPNQAPRRQFSGFPVVLAMLGPLILWTFCFAALNHGRKPEAFLLLAGAIFLTVHVLKQNRGGFMSNPNVSMAGEMMSGGSSLGGFASSVARGVVGLVGSILLTVSILLALSVATNVPGLFASGVLDRRLPHELAMTFGTPQWPRLMMECATAACLVTSVLSMVVLLVARRHGGGAHMIRTVLGVLVLLGAAIALGRALPDLAYVTPAATPGDTVDLYFQQVQFPAVVKASFVFLLGAFLLGWPARRSPRVPIIQQAPSANKDAGQ